MVTTMNLFKTLLNLSCHLEVTWNKSNSYSNSIICKSKRKVVAKKGRFT